MKTFRSVEQADRALPHGAIYLHRRTIRRAGTNLVGVYLSGDGAPVEARTPAEVTHWAEEDPDQGGRLVDPVPAAGPGREPEPMLRLNVYMAPGQVAHLRSRADYRGMAAYVRQLIDKDINREIGE